jgi:antitoxin ParD1/3/4
MNQEALNPQNGMINLSLLLPESFKDFIDQQVAKGGYSAPDEYLCDLIQEAKERAVEEHLEMLLLEALDSGPATPMTKADWEEIKQRGIERIQQKPSQQLA